MIRWLKDKWQRDLVTLREKREKERRERRILCPKCGYDVKILPDQPCPECGLFIESAWRGGWWGAGSPWRRFIPFMLGITGFNSSLRPAVLLFAGLLLAQDGGTTWMTPEARVQYFAAGGVLVSWGLICVGTLVVAIVRRRWLMYGPRRYATRIALILLAAVICGGFTAQYAITAYSAFLEVEANALRP
ncbi:MAG: hypothetical protein HND58_00635 [Planctomycetota bacterium]|nr:MAG: hypothetical protein HND58_00635 [Planctomycetota bacterium]